MFKRPLVLIACLAGAATLALASGASPRLPASAGAPAAAEPDYAKLVSEKGAAMVTIKYVLRIDFGGQQQEREQERTGVLIDGKGLVLCTNSSVGGIPPALSRRYANVTLTPTNIKILIGDDTDGVDAKLIARDSDLDLAWIKIDKAPEKPYTFVNFAGAPDAKVGEHLIILDRLPKTFDRATQISDMRVGAVIKKPRPMLHGANTLQHISAPIFTDDLKAVGFAATFLAAEEDQESDEQQAPIAVVVPAAEIVAATERALKTAESNPIKEPAPAGEAPSKQEEEKK